MPTRIPAPLAALAVLLVAFPAGAAAGDVRGDIILLKDVIRAEPPNRPDGVQRPARGMTMDEVQRVFGDPHERHAAVGDPPITRWVYEEYTVYFEHEYVLQSVLERDAPGAVDR